MCDEFWDDYIDCDADSAPYEPPRPTAEAQINDMVAQAKRKLTRFISALTAKHMREMRNGKLPNGIFDLRTNTETHFIEANRLGQAHRIATGQTSTTHIICTMEQAIQRFQHRHSINIEDCGIPGEWMASAIRPSERSNHYQTRACEVILLLIEP